MTDYDVAVVGAGAAGVGAARALAATGLSVVVLEAGARVGGRARTQVAAGVPLDLGCGWLHSADRNPWTAIAERHGLKVDRRTPAWGKQHRDLGFTPEDAAAAGAAMRDLQHRLHETPPEGDRAANALEPGGRWNTYLQVWSEFFSGDVLQRISVEDLTAYEEVSTSCNWRVMEGYGRLVQESLPDRIRIELSTPVRAIDLAHGNVVLTTPAGTVRARAAVLTMSTDVIAGGAIAWPSALEPWREAARHLPLGHNEKLFLEVTDAGPFEPETSVIGDADDPVTGAYYIRPFGWPVIECFYGGKGARAAAADRSSAFERAVEQLARLFGSSVRRRLRPLAASDWTNAEWIGGAYSHALPGHASARRQLAKPFEGRLFFAGEATHRTGFSTAHGAYESGLRAAHELAAALAGIEVSVPPSSD